MSCGQRPESENKGKLSCWSLRLGTKFSKKIITHQLVLDDQLLNYVLEWYEYLTKVRKFKTTDPMFPRCRVVRSEDTGEFTSTGVESVFWMEGIRVRDVFLARSKEAGVPYFTPHQFRQATSQLAQLKCTNLEELRAISQNLGHEDMGTTIRSYGRLAPERISAVVRAIDFQSDDKDIFDDEFERKIRLLIAKKKKEKA